MDDIRRSISRFRRLPHVATAAAVVVFALFMAMMVHSRDMAAMPDWPFYAVTAVGLLAAIGGVLLRSWPVFNAGAAIALTPFAASFVMVIIGLALRPSIPRWAVTPATIDARPLHAHTIAAAIRGSMTRADDNAGCI